MQGFFGCGCSHAHTHDTQLICAPSFFFVLCLTCTRPPQGVVDRVVDGGFVGEVEMLDSGDVVRVDQAQLETVIPQVCIG